MTRQKLWRTAVLGVATVVWGMFCATQFAAAQATQYFSDAAGNLTWDNGVTKDWSNVSGGTPTGVYNVVFTASAYNYGVFEGTGGTVNVSGTVYSNGLTFNANGYVFNGGVIQLGGPTGGVKYNVASGCTTTINSALNWANSSSILIANGAGTLVLDGTGSNVEGLQANGGTVTMAGGSLTDLADFHVSNGGVGAFTMSAAV